MDLEAYDDAAEQNYEINTLHLEQEIGIFWPGIEAWIASTVWEAEYEF